MQAYLISDMGVTHLPPFLTMSNRNEISNAEGLMSVCEHVSGMLGYEKHAQHVQWTITISGLDPVIWLGVPDVVVQYDGKIMNRDTWRISGNLAHCLCEPWVINVEELGDYGDGIKHKRKMWQRILQTIAHNLAPTPYKSPLFDPLALPNTWELIKPVKWSERFVSVLVEDSAYVCHRLMSRLTGVFSMQSAFVHSGMSYGIYPDFRDYLNEVGFMKGDDSELDSHFAAGAVIDKEKGHTKEPLWEGGVVSEEEAAARSRIGNAMGSLEAQQVTTALAVAEAVEGWLKKCGVKTPAAKVQAQAAASYYIGAGINARIVCTASIMNWNTLIADVEANINNPSADLAVRECVAFIKPLIEQSLANKI